MWIRAARAAFCSKSDHLSLAAKNPSSVAYSSFLILTPGGQDARSKRIKSPRFPVVKLNLATDGTRYQHRSMAAWEGAHLIEVQPSGGCDGRADGELVAIGHIADAHHSQPSPLQLMPFPAHRVNGHHRPAVHTLHRHKTHSRAKLTLPWSTAQLTLDIHKACLP